MVSYGAASKAGEAPGTRSTVLEAWEMEISVFQQRNTISCQDEAVQQMEEGENVGRRRGNQTTEKGG